MLIRELAGDATARCAHQITLLDQVRLDHVFDGVACFADRRGEIVESGRTAVETLDQHHQQLAVHQVEAIAVDRQQLHCLARQRSGNLAVAPHRSEEHTSELQSLMRISYAVFCLKKKNLFIISRYFYTHS